MKKLLPLFIVCLLIAGPVQSFAQKCKFAKDETDAFTKERHRTSELMKISKAPFWWIVMEQKGNDYFITLHIFLMKEVREVITKGTKVMAKLEDGTIIEFIVMDDVNPTFNVEQEHYVVSQWQVKLGVSKDQLMQLSKSPIEQMRTTIGTNENDMPNAISKGTEKVMKTAGCMLNTE